MELEDIKKHWEQAAREFPREGRITPTSRDPYLGLLEEENILNFLKPEHVALEIGCGDGSHTVRYAQTVKKLSGLDLISDLLTIARQRLADAKLTNVDFIRGSVLDLTKCFAPATFTCVITQRCLINLPEWRYQQEAIRQVHELLRRGGLLLFTEGFQPEMDTLNEVRLQFGLPAIAVVYNRNFVREELEPFVEPYFDIVERRHYGPYFFLSRLFHPLAVLPDEPRHDSRLNEVAMEIAKRIPASELERYSYNRFYALRKK
jgi:ubiquinone/menaquinone biosynthesis C-methylase UbiE